MTKLDGLQGNVLVGYKPPCASYLFATVTDGAAARGWLSDRPDLSICDWISSVCGKSPLA